MSRLWVRNSNGVAKPQPASPCHILTVDVEDWPQSTLNHALPIGERVVANTLALLELLDEANVRATFFVLGKVAEKHPRLAREIAVAGHEVATHGYSHESVAAMSNARFAEELHRSVGVLRNQTGQTVSGHRAADFSISARHLHLLEYLAEEGISYDSSIFPVLHPRYGIPGAQRYPHLIRCASQDMLVEFPPLTTKFGGFVLPGAGGGYFRLFPYWWTSFALRSIEHSGYPATCYFHPYEIDVNEIHEIPYAVPPLLRFSQFTNRGSVKAKLRRLLSNFRFNTMAQACNRLKSELEVALDLAVQPIAYGQMPLRVPA